MSLRFLRIPPGASIQGAERRGNLNKGIPIGGPFDVFSAQIANGLVGNPSDAPLIESNAGPIEIEVLEPCRIGVSGARLKAKPIRDGKSISIESNSIQTGDRILLEPGLAGVRVYVAVNGGFKTSSKLSATSVANGANLRRADGADSTVGDFRMMFPAVEQEIFARFQPNVTIEPSQSCESTVGVHSDRRGVRLQFDSPIEHFHSLRSEPQCVGAIEWTPNGEWIILGPDGPTIGGYPRIGWVIRASLPAVAQLRPGGKVQIRFVDEQEERRRNAKFDALLKLHAPR